MVVMEGKIEFIETFIHGKVLQFFNSDCYV